MTQQERPLHSLSISVDRLRNPHGAGGLWVAKPWVRRWGLTILWQTAGTGGPQQSAEEVRLVRSWFYHILSPRWSWIHFSLCQCHAPSHHLSLWLSLSPWWSRSRHHLQCCSILLLLIFQSHWLLALFLLTSLWLRHMTSQLLLPCLNQDSVGCQPSAKDALLNCLWHQPGAKVLRRQSPIHKSNRLGNRVFFSYFHSHGGAVGGLLGMEFLGARSPSQKPLSIPPLWCNVVTKCSASTTLTELSQRLVRCWVRWHMNAWAVYQTMQWNAVQFWHSLPARWRNRSGETLICTFSVKRKIACRLWCNRHCGLIYHKRE